MMRSDAGFEPRSCRPGRRGRWASLLLIAAVAAIAAATGPASASAASGIEGIWSFNGGQIAIQGQSNGTYTGTVVAATKFSQCYHPVGEHMWTEMRLQPDGSYWGFHQWYFTNSSCVSNPELGLTAWRVLTTSDGSTFLRVCFSEPGSNSQPTIAADGTSAGATYGCSDSSLISSLPAQSPSEAGKSVSIKLPPNKSCSGRSKMRIKLREATGDPFAKVFVGLKSGRIHRRAKLSREHGEVVATLSLKHLIARTFKVKIRLSTVLGASYSAQRTYRRCALRPAHKGHRHHGGH